MLRTLVAAVDRGLALFCPTRTGMRSSADKGALVTGHRPVSCFSSYRASSSAKRRRRGARAAEKAKGGGKNVRTGVPSKKPSTRRENRPIGLDRARAAGRAVGGSAYLECLGHERGPAGRPGGDHGPWGSTPQMEAMAPPTARHGHGRQPRSVRRAELASVRFATPGERTNLVRSRSPVASAAVDLTACARRVWARARRRVASPSAREAPNAFSTSAVSLVPQGFGELNSALGHS